MSPDMRMKSPRRSQLGRRSRLAFIRRTLLLAALVLAGTTGSAWGATLSFTGAFSNDWNTAGNWTNTANAALHAVPTAADDARIPLGAAPVLGAGANGAARSILLDPGASLSVSGRTLAVAGGAASTLGGPVTLSNATLSLGGATTWRGGNWSLTGSTVANAGTLTITGDATLSGAGASNVANTGTISRDDATPASGAAIFTAPLTNGGTFSVANGTA